MKPDGMRDEAYKRYQEQGFTEEDIAQIWQHTLYFRARMAEKREEREITSSTYERAQARLKKDVDDWFGRR